ncbi:MAG: 1-deoxy-D-xylulose-5-phosphate synthase [Clostridia bacterium]|nr:1-deoxy-D-xylulose-5-phosphate synthase [Clostridia bacterium]
MAYSLLDSIHGIDDLKKLRINQLDQLAAEIRGFMIESVSNTGGHLASSLGAIELIIATHYVFDSPRDRIVFDVGHQSYAHKILTGRREQFALLRQEGGISGFPKREESEHDAFNTGHASTSISAALGMARARKLLNEEGSCVAFIGDGAMTGGLAMEAMDDIDDYELPLVLILNDNEMSIAPNVGAVNRRLTKLRTNKGYVRFKRCLVRTLDTSRGGKWLSRHMERTRDRVKRFIMPNLPFEDFGLIYLGPVDGHDIKKLIKMLRSAKELHKPVIVHARTIKGKGYSFSETNPERFHGIAPFSVMTGKVRTTGQMNCSEVFGKTMLEIAQRREDVVAITAAMPSGTGLSEFSERYPSRFFDVGIAEEHALTMAAGMATVGIRPVVAIYSSFLQRGYDELLHDICLQNLPVVVAVDRAGLVGEDGETHQGIFDPAFLITMPNLTVYSPATLEELSVMLNMAVDSGRPSAVRYNRGTLPSEKLSSPVAYGKWEIKLPIAEVTVVSTGTMLPIAHWVAKKHGVGLVHARFLSPLDREVLDEIQKKRSKVLVVEENVLALGGILAHELNPCRVRTLCLPNEPVTHACIDRQREWYGLTEKGIETALRELAVEE